MTDLARTAMWLGILSCGLVAAVGLRRLQVPATYVRDLLHVGAGIWVLGWPDWHSSRWPVAIAVAAAIALLVTPLLSNRLRAAEAVRDAVANGDERWTGLSLYGLAFALFTWVGLHGAPWPAAAALAALAMGDGIGGAVGRRFGHLHYRAPGGKRKTLEGSITVAVCAAAGIFIVAGWFGQAPPLGWIAVAGVTAALAEALAPRSTDNLIVPLAVYAALRLL